MAYEVTEDFRFSETGAVVNDYEVGEQFEELPKKTLEYAIGKKFVKKIKAVTPKSEEGEE